MPLLGVGLLAVEDGHSPDRSGALTAQALFDGGGDLLAFVACGAGWVGTALDRVQVFERWARRVTAVVFIVIGAYETLRSTLKVLPSSW